MIKIEKYNGWVGDRARFKPTLSRWLFVHLRGQFPYPRLSLSAQADTQPTGYPKRLQSLSLSTHYIESKLVDKTDKWRYIISDSAILKEKPRFLPEAWV